MAGTTPDRTMLSVDEKTLLLRIIRDWVEKKTVNKEATKDWLDAQAAFRLAEALARPKRGTRAHKLKGYEWYFWNDREAPLRLIERWIGEMASSARARPV